MKIRNLILLLIISVALSLQAQKNTNVVFDGKVLVQGKNAEGVKIKVFENTKALYTFTTSKTGRFFFTAGKEKNYVLEFSKNGYKTERVAVCTENTRRIYKKIKPYKFHLQLVPESKGAGVEGDMSLAMIKIDPETKEFKLNREFAKEWRQAMGLDNTIQIASR